MITIRPAAERGATQIDWLDSRHTFSFGDYYDPRHMNFGPLRVINDDRVAEGRGFGTHGHRDMEIITYVLDGALAHQDSIGTGATIRPGEIQIMSAGTGIQHSEMNPSPTEPVHLLQIWIVPERRNLVPRYDQQKVDVTGRLTPIVTPDGRDGSIVIHQDASMLAARLDAGQTASHALAPGRGAWVHVARGSVQLGDRVLEAGDGAAVEDESAIALVARSAAEVLVFDVPLS
ncbi:MAG TPA: pirin family protein [Candidatus Binatia bacterium]|jgi:redox-sensitive bicupin YhaK (pirin superfamily)|nr:pirin family protein [Candidatus Binatia bacterium]